MSSNIHLIKLCEINVLYPTNGKANKITESARKFAINYEQMIFLPFSYHLYHISNNGKLMKFNNSKIAENLDMCIDL